MLNHNFLDFLSSQLEVLKKEGLYKEEHILSSPQDTHIKLLGGKKS